MAVEFPISVSQTQVVPESSPVSHQLLGAGEGPSPIRVTSTFWEEENTLVYHVHVDNFQVSRRGDNNYINGTKLLNLAGLTRGRRDGILKSERDRVVVKIGAMCLKGVWIPLERAKLLAAREDILDAIKPLFAPDIHAYQSSASLRQVLPPVTHPKPSIPVYQPPFSEKPQMEAQLANQNQQPYMYTQPPGAFPQMAPQMLKYQYPPQMTMGPPAADDWTYRMGQQLYPSNQFGGFYSGSNQENSQQPQEYPPQPPLYFPTYNYAIPGRVPLPTPPATSRTQY